VFFGTYNWYQSLFYICSKPIWLEWLWVKIIIFVQNPFGLSGCGLRSYHWEHYSTLSELLTWQIRVVEPYYLSCTLYLVLLIWVRYSILSELLTWQIRVVEPFYQTVWLGTLLNTV